MHSDKSGSMTHSSTGERLMHAQASLSCVMIRNKKEADKNESVVPNVTGPAKTGHICTKYTRSVKGMFLGHCLR